MSAKPRSRLLCYLSWECWSPVGSRVQRMTQQTKVTMSCPMLHAGPRLRICDVSRNSILPILVEQPTICLSLITREIGKVFHDTEEGGLSMHA